MEDIQVSVGSVEQPQTMEVSVKSETSEREIVNGLEKVITQEYTRDHRAGYEIYTKTCTQCGAEVDHGTRDLEVKEKKDFCPRCGHNRYIGKEYLHKGKTEKVLNTKLRYKCATCERMYDVPTPCCTFNDSLTLKDKAQSAWYCTGCSRIYADKPLYCCSKGKLIPGQAIPATRAEYHAIPKIMVPYNL